MCTSESCEVAAQAPEISKGAASSVLPAPRCACACETFGPTETFGPSKVGSLLERRIIV
jgi:hypothetical protein